MASITPSRAIPEKAEPSISITDGHSAFTRKVGIASNSCWTALAPKALKSVSRSSISGQVGDRSSSLSPEFSFGTPMSVSGASFSSKKRSVIRLIPSPGSLIIPSRTPSAPMESDVSLVSNHSEQPQQSPYTPDDEIQQFPERAGAQSPRHTPQNKYA